VVSLLLGFVAFACGILAAIVIPLVAPLLRPDLQTKIGAYWFSQAMRGFGPSVLIWREMGNPEIKSFSMNDEWHVAQATLSSGVLSEDQQLPFKDPDGRIHRWKKKPFAVVPELLPAAVDAELAEAGYWKRQKELDDGLVATDGGVDPYVTWDTDLRAVNPNDAFYLSAKGVDPENVKTAKDLTEARYAKYNGGLGVKEEATMLISFATGAGVVAGLAYLRKQVIADGGGSSTGGGSTVPIPGMVDPGQLQIATDVLVGGFL